MKYTIIASALFAAIAWAAPKCECESPTCPQAQPFLCQCQNAAAQRCFETCGLPYIPQDCSGLTVREPQQETCQCEEVACIQVWPESCYCANNAARECYGKCGGVEPEYQDCGADVGKRTTLEKKQEPTCECEDMFCTLDWPGSCYCQNDNKRRCFEKCGGVAPTYQECPPKSPALSARLPAPTKDLSGAQRCGSRGMAPCPDHMKCIEDPNLGPGECGMSCDIPGYCVPN